MMYGIGLEGNETMREEENARERERKNENTDTKTHNIHNLVIMFSTTDTSYIDYYCLLAIKSLSETNTKMRESARVRKNRIDHSSLSTCA